MSFEGFATNLLRHRRLAVWGILAVVLVAGWGAKDLGFDFSPQNIFVSQSEDFALLEELQRVFGRDDNLLLVLIEADDAFRPDVLAELSRLHEALAGIDGIVAVEDLTTAQLVEPGASRPSPALGEGESGDVVRRRVEGQPLVQGRWVSRDGKALLMALSIADGRMDYDELSPIVSGVREVLAASPDAGVSTAGLVGIPLARVLLVERLTGDQIGFLPLCLLLFSLVLWFLYRDLRAVLVPLGAVVVSLLLCAALLGFTGEKINIINNVLPTLLFVIGVSDAIHVLSRYRLEMYAGRDRERALHISVVHLGVACLLTSVTTAVGFASLATGRLHILQRFGFYSAAGVMIAYVVTIVIVPVALSYTRRPMPKAARKVNEVADRAARSVAVFTYRRRKAILVVAAVLIVGSAALAGRVRVENHLFEAFPDSDPVVDTNRRLESHFPGIVPFAIAVRWQAGADPLRPEALAYLDQLGRFMDSLEQVDGVFSIVDVLAEVNVALHDGDAGWRRPPDAPGAARLMLDGLRSVADGSRLVQAADRFYSEEHRLLRVTASVGDIGSRALAETARLIEERLVADRATHESLGLELVLNGDGRVGSAAVDRLIGDLLRSLVVAFLVIFGLMAAVFGLRPALVAMIPNVFPLLVTLGVMGAVGLDLQVATVIVFSVALGLAVDDTIHFLVRFREEWAESSGSSTERYRLCLDRTLRGTGQAIFATSLLLAVGYSVLLFSNFPITQRFGIGMLMTVTAALVGDLFVLPACLAVFRPFRASPRPRRTVEPQLE